MEPSCWQSAAPGGKAPRKKRRSSPLPGAAVPPGRASRRAGVSQSCRRLLFGSAGPRGPEAGSKRLSSRRRRSAGPAVLGWNDRGDRAGPGGRTSGEASGAGAKAGGGCVLCFVQYLCFQGNLRSG